MNKFSPYVVIFCAALAGCTFGAGPAKVTKTSYTLAPPTAGVQMPSGSGAAESTSTLQIATVQAPVWLNTQALYYQLDYSANGRLAAYSQSEWVAAPPELLAHLLQQRLSAMNAWKAVVGPDSTVAADYALQVNLQDFRQEFSTPHISNGVLQAQATLTRNKRQSIIAQQSFEYRVPAPSADAQGAVDALSKASHHLAADLGRWLNKAMAPGGGGKQ